MKSIKKYLFIMAALAAVFGFVACSDEDDEPSTVAEYKATYSPSTYMMTFLDNGTWSQTVEYNGKKMTMTEGTYKGDPSVDNGKIYLTVTKSLTDDKLTEIKKEYQEEETITITNKKFTYNYIMTFTRQ